MGAIDSKNININETLGRILLIDDDELSLELISSALKGSYDLRLVSQGSEAIDSALNFKPDIIILDLNMPNVDGYEILSQANSHPTLSGIPIICLSGEKSFLAREQTRKLGAAGFLTKPIKKSQIREDIQLLLKNSNIEIESADKNRIFHIGYNTTQKENAIHSKIGGLIENKQKVLLLTLSSGRNFCNSLELEAVEKENLYFLQFKANILSKIPFMEDLTPILSDLEDFIGENTMEWNLMIDDPDILLNIYDSSSSQGHIFLFSEMLDRHFRTVSFFCKNPSSELMVEKLNTLAKILIGRI